MQKIAFILLLTCFGFSSSKSQVSNNDECKSYSFPEELVFYSNSFTQDWLLEEISPDSVHNFYFQNVFDYYEGLSIDEVSSKNLSGDRLFMFNFDKDRSILFAKGFLTRFEAGNQIWSFDNAPSKPGSLRWEYGLLILDGCHLKFIRPIIQS